MDWIIPFSGRSHQYTEAEEQEVLRVMREAVPLTQGIEKSKFEQKFSKTQKVPYSFAVSNATAALELAAELCELTPEDEVLIPTHTFTSSAYPFLRQGAKIVWVDMDAQTRVSEVAQYEAQRTPRTKVIVVVHLYGYSVNMREIRTWADQHNILIVEDNAQSLGAVRDGVKTGELGDFSVASFHSHKNITTLGEGGMLSVRDQKYSQVIPLIRHNGHAAYEADREFYWKPAMGDVVLPELNGKAILPHNFCLGEVECALGAMLLDRLELMNFEKRQRAIGIIDQLNHIESIKFHRVDDSSHTYHLLVAEMPSTELRDQFLFHLSTQFKIQGVVQYNPLHRYPLYQKLGLSKASCPNSEKFFDSMISFPFHHSLTNNQIEYMVDSIIKTAKHCGIL